MVAKAAAALLKPTHAPSISVRATFSAISGPTKGGNPNDGSTRVAQAAAASATMATIHSASEIQESMTDLANVMNDFPFSVSLCVGDQSAEPPRAAPPVV